MSLRDDLLPDLDDLRGIPDDLGLRRFTITVRVRTWSGARAGLGTKTDVDTVLRVRAGSAPVKVEQVTQKEILASGGKFADRDMKVGPMTPDFPGGGVALSTIDPATTSTGREVLWIASGPGLPTAGVLCDKIATYADKNLNEYVVLRATGRTP